jgi:adenosylcobinamide-GDP ribazoletransferase
MTPRLAREAAAFRLALGFLTRLPVGGRYTPARMAAATAWLPAAGLLIGLLAAAVFLAASRLFPPAPALLLATAATLLLTGALHEDGLADTADALAAPTPERALAIMRDSRIGAYGALALGLTFALRIAALAAMPPALAATALVAAHGASRAAPVLVIATSRYVRPEGAATFTAAGVSPRRLALALATALLCLALVALAAGPAAALGALLALAAAQAASRALTRRLGGYTGDTLGAAQQLAETALPLGVLACL